MDLNIKVVYKGRKTLRQLILTLEKAGLYMYMRVKQHQYNKDCVRTWDGWIKIGEKTTSVKNICIPCLLRNIDYISKEEKKYILVEIYLHRTPSSWLVIKRDSWYILADRF